MAESIPAAWISDYLIDAAETYGAQHYDVPPFKKKKRVQLIEFLTFHENSYVWAWASDKTHRIPIRISREAAEEFKVQNRGRNIIDHRFAPVFIKHFRPIFSPHPLGGTLKGNTPTSHIALEVGSVERIGPGTHIFGDPKDVELNSLVQEWVTGLRQDGGGGNVLKLRKQEQPSTVQPLPRPPTPNILEKVVEPALKPAVTKQMPDPVRPQRPIDFKRAYSKRWRPLEIDRWKFAYRTPQQTADVLESGLPALARNITEVPHTPEPEAPVASVSRGTPTEWSPSPRRSPVQANPETPLSRNPDTEILPSYDVQPEAPPEESVRHPSDPQNHSLQPLTPSQCNKTASPPPSPPQQASSPLPPSSPLAFSGSLTNLCKNVKRKVLHPGVPLLPDPNHSGPTQILVPNSDTSAMMSSQPSQSHVPLLPSSLSNGFKPGEASTPRKTSPNGHPDSSRHVLRMSAEVISGQPVHGVHSTPHTLETGLANNSTMRGVDRGVPDRVSTSHESAELSEDDAETKAVLEKSSSAVVPSMTNEMADSQFASSSPSSMRSLFSASPSQKQPSGTTPTPNKPGSAPYNGGATPVHDPDTWKEPSFMRSRKGKGRAVALEELPGEKGEQKRRLSHQTTPLSKKVKMDEQVNIEGQASPRAVKAPNRTLQKTASDREGSYVRETPRADVQHSETPESRRKPPRLAGLAVDFTKIPHGPNHRRPRMTWANFRATLLRTGRIRTLGEEVEQDGSVYLDQD